MMQNLDPKTLEEIQKQFDKIVNESGVSPDEDIQKELESLLEMSFGMEKDIDKGLKTISLGVQKMHPNSVFPKYNYESDSGFDLHSVEDIVLPPFGRALVPTGIKLNIPLEYEVQIRPKSGLALNQGLTVLNTPGTVDSGYNGEIKVIIFNTNNISIQVTKGMKVAQAVLCPVVCGKYVSLEDVDEIDGKDRGDNGFGSTGI
jgi:dUTP pyrophosphatase